MAIEISERGAQELSRIMNEQECSDLYLRMSLKGGGCSGFNYHLDFAKEPTDFDHVFDSKGIKIIVDKKSYIFMNGTVLDFSDGLIDRGFQFKNPIAKSSCGCGTSFGI
ncbi:iron-sulfur cluster assembly accessory protein [bacterium]|jgi:iron-sulfur cluster assembly protein|nr:iron-sulfur cluster assembly accessory protein [bacterium]